MRKKILSISLLIILSTSLTGCKEWIMFDISRLAFGFIFTLVIGVIGLIIMGLKGKNNN